MKLRSHPVSKERDGVFESEGVVRSHIAPSKVFPPVDGFKFEILTRSDLGQFDLNSKYISFREFAMKVRRLDAEGGWNQEIDAKIGFLAYVGAFIDKREYIEFDIVIKPSESNDSSFIVELDNQCICPVDLNRKSAIPRIVHQTQETRTLSVRIQNAMLSILEKNPEYELRYYDSNDRRKFLLTHFQHNLSLPEWCRDEKFGALACYDAIRPGAFKADIFRLAALYIEGGLY